MIGISQVLTCIHIIMTREINVLRKDIKMTRARAEENVERVKQYVSHDQRNEGIIHEIVGDLEKGGEFILIDFFFVMELVELIFIMLFV